MKNRAYYTVETIPKSNIKIVERDKKHEYMTAHFPVLVAALQ